MTVAIVVSTGTTPMVKLTDVWNSMGAIIAVEAKAIYDVTLVRHTKKVATRVITNKNLASI